MFWLSFAVAAADGWREPAFACAFIVALRAVRGVSQLGRHVAPRAFGGGGVRGTRTRRRFSAASPRTRTAALTRTRDAGARARGCTTTCGAETRRSVRRFSPAERAEVRRSPRTRRRARRFGAVQAVPAPRTSTWTPSACGPRTRTRIPPGVSAFGGQGGRAGGARGGGLGSEFGGDSEAGYSETVRSELSAAVFADAPPVLLTAAQLRTQYVRRPAQTARPARGSSAAPAGGIRGRFRHVARVVYVVRRSGACVVCARDTRCLFCFTYKSSRTYKSPRSRRVSIVQRVFCSAATRGRHRVSDGRDSRRRLVREV